MTNITLSAQELDLLQRGPGSLIHAPEGDQQVAGPARVLLARLEQASASLREPASEAGRR